MEGFMRNKRIWTAFVVSVVIGFALAVVPGCAHPPSSLSPVGVVAFHQNQLQSALDKVRDVAVDANTTTPPVLSTATTRKVVQWHESTIKVIHDAASGWQAAVNTGLDELLKDVPPNEAAVLVPYVTLAKTVLSEVTQ